MELPDTLEVKAQKVFFSMCRSLAEAFCGKEVMVVVGPGIIGRLIAEEVAANLSKLENRPIDVANAEYVGDHRNCLVIKRNHQKIVRGKNVLVIDNTFPTREYANEIVKSVREIGGSVVGVGVFHDCVGLLAVTLGVPKFISLDQMN